MIRFIQRLWSDDTGQGMVEYGLILALVAIAAIVILTTLGDQLTAVFSNVSDELEGALTP